MSGMASDLMCDSADASEVLSALLSNHVALASDHVHHQFHQPTPVSLKGVRSGEY